MAYAGQLSVVRRAKRRAASGTVASARRARAKLTRKRGRATMA
jgi:hypothetical protein